MRNPVSNHYLDDQEEDGKLTPRWILRIVAFEGRTWINRTMIGLYGGLLVLLLLAHMNQFRAHMNQFRTHMNQFRDVRDRIWILFWVKVWKTQYTCGLRQ